MKCYVFFKGSKIPDVVFPSKGQAMEYMKEGRYTGIVVTAYPPRIEDESVEILWYDKGEQYG